MNEGKVVSVEYLKAEDLPESIRIKHELGKSGIVKATVCRNSPATIKYSESVNPIDEVTKVFENLRGKTF